MDELERIRLHVSKYIELNDEEEHYFFSLLRINRVRKKQFIVQPDFVCKYRSYVYRGAMRAYLFDHHSQEHTIAFAIEDWWISDYNSFIFQQPATLFVEALEDSTLIQIEYSAEQKLMEQVPKFEKFFRIVTSRSFAFLQQRMLSNLSKSAEERYEEFLNKYPAMAQRVPQYALASYLGMSHVYLSQLRNNRAGKKS